MEKRLRESTRIERLLRSRWARLLVLVLSVCAVAVFLVTPTLIRPLAACRASIGVRSALIRSGDGSWNPKRREGGILR